MAGISVSGLISNSFDWKSVVDQLIQIDSAPIARMQTEQAENIDKLASLATLETKITDLETATQALTADGLFDGRTASSSSSGSTWTATAADLAATGNYQIAVTQLATAARWAGASAISNPISATDDVSELTLASIPTATAITAGTFSINGNRVTIELSDTLQTVFTKISEATGGVVTASYSAATDRITLESNDASKIILGAANDSSNFLGAMRLATNDSDTITSSSTLGSASPYAKLTSSRLSGGFGSVDGSGNGRFTVNGVPIDYNINNDSLAAVFARITASTAGVTATYDMANDRVILTNKSTGDMGVGVADITGTLLGALGLTTDAGGALERGDNAKFSVNGGVTLSSLSNTLDQSSHGIAGLNVIVNTETTQTINVAPDTESMKTAIQDFITKYNAVQSYVESTTRITKTADGKVNAAILADDHEVSAWGSELRALAVGQVSAFSGTISRLEQLGIGFTAFEVGMTIETWSSSSNLLEISDSAKLDAALANKGADVDEFFNTATTGFATKMKAYLSTRFNSLSGALANQKETLSNQNTGIDAQIATLNRRLEHQRELLTSSFLAMQTAQSQAQQQQTAITNMWESMNRKS